MNNTEDFLGKKKYGLSSINYGNQIGVVNGIPINHVVMGNVTGLPDPQQDTVFIVSRIVADAVKDRQDVLIVDKTIRDADGKITGCLALAHV